MNADISRRFGTKQAICKFLVVLLMLPAQARFFIEFPRKKKPFVSSLNIRSISLPGLKPWAIRPLVLAELDSGFDTRLEVGVREDYIIFFPRPRQFPRDPFARGEFHMTPAGTAIGCVFTGPIEEDIRMIGVVAGDFLGPEEVSIGLFRDLFTFGFIQWRAFTFLFGYYWHPLIIPECFPQTVSGNLGSPYEARARAPQIKVAYSTESWAFVLAAASQLNFFSPGPFGLSADYIRNSVVPNIDAQIRHKFGEHTAGVAIDFLRLVPRIESNKDVRVNETNTSWIGQIWAAFNFPSFSVRMKAIYAQNGADQALISGYGVHSINPVTDERTYTNTASVSAWLDSSYVLQCLPVELGVFVGGTKNLGSHRSLALDPITGQPIIYTFLPVVSTVDTTYRISPRVVFIKDPVRFGLELEFIRASFGCPDRFGRPRNVVPVSNVRLTASFFYVF